MWAADWYKTRYECELWSWEQQKQFVCEERGRGRHPPVMRRSEVHTSISICVVHRERKIERKIVLKNMQPRQLLAKQKFPVRLHFVVVRTCAVAGRARLVVFSFVGQRSGFGKASTLARRLCRPLLERTACKMARDL